MTHVVRINLWDVDLDLDLDLDRVNIGRSCFSRHACAVPEDRIASECFPAAWEHPGLRRSQGFSVISSFEIFGIEP
jgi:hypothetical protein